ncbi:hypothetical protein Btru_038788 [Bulinus truncatus]|nr:hypothetical protein Btru_038788 [Bulinus truncatus]
MGSMNVCLLVAIVLFTAATAAQPLKDWTQKLSKLDKSKGGYRRSGHPGQSLPKDDHNRTLLNRQTTSCAPDDFQCDDGQCIPYSWRCDFGHDCVDHSDEFHCIQDCTGEHQFQCTNGNCVPSNYYCDGDNDCGDLTDEQDCDLVPCTESEFRCDNHICIDASWVCDGFDNCRTGWDEINCTCRHDQFECADGSRCISHDWICNGVSECHDNSDELNCVCDPDTKYTCANGRCIPNNWRCDGDNDCGDVSDEIGCPTLHPSVCADVLSIMACALMNETVRPICDLFYDGHRFCRKYCDLCSDGVTVFH